MGIAGYGQNDRTENHGRPAHQGDMAIGQGIEGSGIDREGSGFSNRHRMILVCP